MSHKLLSDPIIETRKQKRFILPNFNGKFGFSVFAGSKEVFIGISVGEVEIERVVRKRLMKNPKAGVSVFRFD